MEYAFFMSSYSLRKSRRILRSSYRLYQKKKQTLTESEQRQFETDLRTLDQAALESNKAEASTHAKRIETFTKTRFSKTVFEHLRDLAYALAFAIVVAFLIRQFWFELYE